VIGISARKNDDINRLKDFIFKNISENFSENITENITGNIRKSLPIFAYDSEIETAVAMLIPHLSILDKTPLSKRFTALKLLDNTEKIMLEILENSNIDLRKNAELLTALKHAKDFLLEKNIPQIVLRDLIVQALMQTATSISAKCTTKNENKTCIKTLKIDKILTSKTFGIPIMLCMLGLILWITISGANYPSAWLSSMFSSLKVHIESFLTTCHIPPIICDVLLNGVYTTVTWIVSVMLPPMAIFFPLFTLLEDLGYLPRVAFNLDKYFGRANTCGKCALTMCMGLGCNAVGVTGCRIISSPRERLCAILTNTFMPCNGRFPLLITVSTIFLGGVFGGLGSVCASLLVLALIVFGVIVSLIITKLLSLTLLKGESSSFTLELPPYRRPEIVKTLVRSMLDRTLFVLGRALIVAAPAGIVIWLMANIKVYDLSLLTYCGNFLDPFARLIGLDGYIVLAFILALPANEIVLPLIIMCYLSTSHMQEISDIRVIGELLRANGWTVLTAINVMLFSLLHFPCATTLLTIKKETNSLKWTCLAFIIPTCVAILVCMTTAFIYAMGYQLL
ncbi:MAG: nucleoside recognition domain-containing protein, partial [Oscillospiraceae bacterium]